MPSTPLLCCMADAACLPAGVGAGQAAGGGSTGPVQVKDSPLLLQQIEALQLSIRHLKNENNRLKVSAGRRDVGLEEPPCHDPQLGGRSWQCWAHWC